MHERAGNRELESLVCARIGSDLRRPHVARALWTFVDQRLAELRVSLPAYVALVAREGSAELERLAHVVTTGDTWFRRDSSQFAAVAELLAAEQLVRPVVTIWVAGCSTGEDACSIAAVAAKLGLNADVLGTDLCSRAIDRARHIALGAAAAGQVRFDVHNLLTMPARAPGGGLWDIIVCRNVLGSLAPDSARRVFDRLTRVLAPGGCLLLGTSEAALEVPQELEAIYVRGRLVFRRTRASSAFAPAPAPFRPAWLVGRAEGPKVRGVLSALPPATRALASTSEPGAVLNGDAATAFEQAHAALDQGELRRARDAYLALAGHAGAPALTHLYAGFACYLCGEHERALSELKSALFACRELWPAWLYAGLCYENTGRPAEALGAYRRLLALLDTERDASPELAEWRAELSTFARLRVDVGRRALADRAIAS